MLSVTANQSTFSPIAGTKWQIKTKLSDPILKGKTCLKLYSRIVWAASFFVVAIPALIALTLRTEGEKFLFKWPLETFFQVSVLVRNRNAGEDLMR